MMGAERATTGDWGVLEHRCPGRSGITAVPGGIGGLGIRARPLNRCEMGLSTAPGVGQSHLHPQVFFNVPHACMAGWELLWMM